MTIPEDVREALAAATPGPWTVEEFGNSGEYEIGHGEVLRGWRNRVVMCGEPAEATGIALVDAHLIANAPTWLAALCDENDRLREALERISDLPNGGVPGHAVAVGCRHNAVAWKALHAPDERECEKCDGKGFTMDWGPHTDCPGHEGTPISYGKQIPCSCGDGWVARQALAEESP